MNASVSKWLFLLIWTASSLKSLLKQPAPPNWTKELQTDPLPHPHTIELPIDKFAKRQVVAEQANALPMLPGAAQHNNASFTMIDELKVIAQLGRMRTIVCIWDGKQLRTS